MLYRPQLGNGEYVKLTWPQRCMVWNVIGWPLVDGASNQIHFLNWFYIIVNFALYWFFTDAQVRYIRRNWKNIDMAFIGIATLLLLIEAQIRTFHMALKKESFKRFIAEFYDKIYVSKLDHPLLYKGIQRKTIPSVVITYSYCIVVVAFVIKSLLDFERGIFPTLFRLAFTFDHTASLYRYIPTFLAWIWIAFLVCSMLIGESNMLALTILHLDARYKILQEDLQAISAKLLKNKNDTELANKFRNELVKLIRQNADLSEFAGKLEKTFGFRVFVNFANNSLILCFLGFKLFQSGMTWEGLYYISWLISKTCEAMIVGELGSTLMFTTDQLPSMYYHSNWEQILVHSKDTKANVIAMKTIVVAMELNQKPICLTGLNYFSMTVTTVLKILQGAISYLMWLNAVNNLE